ncbi:hypothetical protein AXF42_Ash020198 [Apostasia shenzhenica]|uniref:CYCLOPS n=1 Tax=Apostasia shenzhenica TaxID=1088818 RepID=A0A2H9ZWW5_9ASPA|nr:hypothetical protein AXF42_Ash020198 [Apostasia shenzhenica]
MISLARNGMPVQGTDRIKHDFTSASNFFNSPTIQTHNQLQTIMSSSNLSTSFNTPPTETSNTFSSVVNVLKDTIEHKKLDSRAQKQNFEESSHVMLNFQRAAHSISNSQRPANQGTTFNLLPSVHEPTFDNSAILDNCLDLKLEGFPAQANEEQTATISREHSQSESSSAAPDLSTGFEVCDVSAQSKHIYTNRSSCGKLVRQGALELGSISNEYREILLENNPSDARKNGSLSRMGSMTSISSVDRADPRKKRRVERSRKMAEAKERTLMPSLPSDMQAILKRCEDLEKEVRSLKLNISFMNRKDSVQIKQIEVLQKQNEELVDEKERLEEEIDRVISHSCKM